MPVKDDNDRASFMCPAIRCVVDFSVFASHMGRFFPLLLLAGEDVLHVLTY